MPITLRRRPYENIATSTLGVPSKKNKKNVEQLQVSPQVNNAAGGDDSLVFEVVALGAAITQNAEVVNEEEDRAPLPA